MYLKEIQASGFKSFADKVNIVLDDNITCIVGPNGSGKSNVVDAVRWVLGEQSVKSLRGDGSMSDVIFSGSKSRNALNVASVCLVFDNSDQYLKVPYTEVSVKRRVYRSGENEYFLNGEKCRLKDIVDLFMDSGIGKESFNIISQGEVQKILSNSPYERRVIFEEAASVLKYKKRKEEAIRKLERTKNNLERVEDIIHELELQLEPLREQSKKAREYIETKEKLEQVEVALLAYEIEMLNSEYQLAKTKLEALNNEIITLSAGSSGSDAEIGQKKVEQLRIENELADLQKELLYLTRQEEKLNGEKKMLQERSKYHASDQKVHEMIATLKENDYKLGNEITILTNEIQFSKDSFNHKTADLNKLEQQVTQGKRKYAEIEREISFKKRDNYELDNKIQVLENFIESGGNLSSSVKAVLNNPRLNGVYDCIGNLIDCDLKFAQALDIALGGSKQFLVVENENVAKDAIIYLKENKLGRCTFFPLNVIRGRYVDQETERLLRIEMGYIDVLANLVQFDPKYKEIVYNQLGNVIVALDIDSANRISRKIRARYKVVTLEGDVVHVGGSITGGVVASSRNIISDRYELERLERNKRENSQVIEELEHTRSEQESSVKQLEEKLYQEQAALLLEKDAIHHKMEQLSDLKEQLEQVHSELKGLDAVVDSSLSKEEDRIMSLFYEAQKKKEETKVLVGRKNQEKEQLKSEIEELEATTKLANSNLNKKQAEVRELEVKVSRMDVKLDYNLNTLSEEYSLTFEKAKENYPLELPLEEARSQVTSYKSTIKGIGMVNIDSIAEFDRVNERYQFLDHQRTDLFTAQDTLLEIIDEMDEVMKEEFKKTFDEIEKEFEVVFKQLFNGGKATLKLTDPNNLLESGVDIIASPPGKKLTTISLLSGGEKTLTAISLLFAILNVRTVPFCLFDEVEAALDEANVDNFGTYLDHYKNKTQFLLITHKKKTMEYAKTLYGITMQESGVSKLVSVKLENK
ncbi:MAG: AAA family ATPase [Bacilli bacterium]|nr:AAA family ATPase [Bacilli bacterium]